MDLIALVEEAHRRKFLNIEEKVFEIGRPDKGVEAAQLGEGLALEGLFDQVLSRRKVVLDVHLVGRVLLSCDNGLVELGGETEEVLNHAAAKCSCEVLRFFFELFFRVFHQFKFNLGFEIQERIETVILGNEFFLLVAQVDRLIG